MPRPDDQQHHDVDLRAIAEARRGDVPARSPQSGDAGDAHTSRGERGERKTCDDALRQSQLELEASRDLYRDLYEYAPVGYLSLSAEGTITTANLTAASLFGLGRDQLVGRCFANLIAHSDSAHWHDRFTRVEHGAAPETCELTLLRADGSPLEARVDCLRAAWHTPDAELRLALTDIARERMSARALAKSEARAGSILKASPAGIGMVVRRVIREVNPAMTDITGYEAGEMLGRSARMLYATDADYAYVGQEKYTQIAARGLGVVETRWRRKDGALRDILLSSAPIDPADLDKGVTFTALDITERKQAEFALAEKERLFRLVAETATDEIYMIDREHRTRYLNPAALRLARAYRCQAHLALEELIGLDAEAVFTDTAIARAFRDEDERAMATGQATSVEDSVVVEGMARSRLTLRSPIRDGQGTVVGLLGIARDITARKQAEAERLAALGRQRDALVREVHHRIKNNLQSVAGLLQRELGGFPAFAERLQTAISQVQAIAIVHGLQASDANETIRFCDTAASICDSIQTRTGRQVTWRIEGERKDFKPVRIDRDEAVAVALIVNELVLNAAKHASDRSCPVEVSLADGRRASLMVRNCVAGDIVFDFGRGIGLNTGLSLVRALLPEQGAELSFRISGEGWLITELVLSAPVIGELSA